MLVAEKSIAFLIEEEVMSHEADEVFQGEIFFNCKGPENIFFLHRALKAHRRG